LIVLDFFVRLFILLDEVMSGFVCVVIKALEEEENKNRIARQTDSPHQQIKTFSPAHTVPSKVFQYVDRKFSESDGNIIKNRASSVSEDQNPKGMPFLFLDFILV
jgi:hypothetical protein